jgi:hypothetical protein
MKAAIRGAQVNTEGEYIARYSSADCGVATGMTAFFCALTIFFLQSGHLRAIAISGILFAWSAVYTLHITGTRIRFAKQGFVARVSWFRRFSAPYAEVQSITARLATLTVRFSDGRSLKFHSGLGDPDTVIAYLQARCPESVELR